MSYLVGRAINGISINGNEWLLDVVNIPMEFDTIPQAKQYLKDNGYEKLSNEELEDTFTFELKNKMENTDRFIDMNIESESITGFFVNDNDVDKVFNMIETITEIGNNSHNTQCSKHDEDCKGVEYYIRIVYRTYLISHPELTEMERFAITAGIFNMFNTGNKRDEEDDNPLRSMVNESKDRLLKALLVKVNGGEEPDFNEFHKIMKEALIDS